MVQPAIVHQTGNALCATERTQLFAYGEQLQTLDTRIGLTDCLDSLRDWLGLDEIVVAIGKTTALTKVRYTGSGYDPEWMDLYVRERFMLVDPIVRAILDGQRFVDRRHMPVPGRKSIATRPRDRPTLGYFLEAVRAHHRAACGFASGITFNGHVALCSMITTPGRSSVHAPLVLCALRPVLYQALMRTLLPEPAIPDLSDRERAILELLATGHNDHQIAKALCISASTVRFHLGNVFEKLGARNRCHAVAIGFQTGLLQP